jgi:hypothetical protein
MNRSVDYGRAAAGFVRHSSPKSHPLPESMVQDFKEECNLIMGFS